MRTTVPTSCASGGLSKDWVSRFVMLPSPQSPAVSSECVDPSTGIVEMHDGRKLMLSAPQFWRVSLLLFQPSQPFVDRFYLPSFRLLHPQQFKDTCNKCLESWLV